MSKIWLLGAGASRGYSGSRTRIRPPLATNYFSTFQDLLISGDFEVKIGSIVNHIWNTRGISPERQASEFDENIEAVFAELDGKLRSLLEERNEDHDSFVETFELSRTFDQFIFWFAHVLNEIQNGEPCPIYDRLIQRTRPGDVMISFNWDTILDRALDASGRWFPDDGYGTSFHNILDGAWREPRQTASDLKLLKLHGSTNWLAPYVTRNLQTGHREWLATPDTVDMAWCIRDGGSWFSAYKDRWRPGYGPYSYFFPPNDPIADLPLMPVIIPPSATKTFSEHDSTLSAVWAAARAALCDANSLIVIGYSFPETDGHAFSLLEEFLTGSSPTKEIEIVDPYPDGVFERVREVVSGRCEVEVHRLTLAGYLRMPEVSLGEAERPPDPEELNAMFGDTESERARQLHILRTLGFCNLNQQRLDISTRDGRRFLDAKVVGEMMMHLQGAYRPEVLEYRIGRIRIVSADGETHALSLSNIWIVNPLKLEGISQADLDAADPDSLDGELKEMIRHGFHCSDDREADYFWRRFIAS